eukprot:m.53202 g.53202  ORF g.53202 m.53202 type:complete len:202 (-) comp13138_c0_seq2:241-846(-)
MADDGDDEVAVQTIAPLVVEYCKGCTMPLEYCAYGPNPADCARRNKTGAAASSAAAAAADAGDVADDAVEGAAEAVSAITIVDDNDAEDSEGEGEGKKKQTRGGKGGKPKKQAQEMEGGEVQIIVNSRTKRKFVTNVIGLSAYGIDVKKAAKLFASRFAASASVIGDEIQILGDHSDEINDFIVEKFPQIHEDDITFERGK